MSTSTRAEAISHDVAEVTPATDLFQRRCACGQHSIAGGSCEGCRRGVHTEPIQARLNVSQPGDRHEREADRIAAAVLRMPDPVARSPRYGEPEVTDHRAPPSIQRQEEDGQPDAEVEEEEEEEEVLLPRRTPGGGPAVTPQVVAKLREARATGTPLPGAARNFFEPRFGRPLDAVRIHADGEAGRLATSLHAQAFTRGQDIYFAPGRYQPGTADGRELLAHELAHTLQQRAGAVPPTTVSRRVATSELSTLESLGLRERTSASTKPATLPRDDTGAEASGEAGSDTGPVTDPDTVTPTTDEEPSVPSRPSAPQAPRADLPSGSGEEEPSNGLLPTGLETPGAPPTAPDTTELADGEAGAPAEEAAVVDTSSEAAVLRSLGEVPVSAFGPALSGANEAVGAMQARARGELVESLPVIERPTGLPRLAERPPAEPIAVEGARSFDPEEVGPREGVPPETSHVEAQGPLPAAHVATRVEEPSDDDGGGSWWDWVMGAVRRFLHRLPTSDAVDTSAGPRPRVDTTGDADPTRNDRTQRASDEEVVTRRRSADEATNADFGEQSIYPDGPPGELRSEYSPSAGLPTPGGAPGAAVSPVVQAGFDRAGAGWLRGEVGERAEQEQHDREVRDRDAQAERETRLEEIDTEKTRVRHEQEQEQRDARQGVADARADWREENRRIQEDYGDQASDRRSEVDRQIDTEVRTTEEQVDDKLSAAEREAEDKRRETERQAEAKRREARNRPRSYWGRLRGAVSAAFDALKDAVNSLFDALRSFVRRVIEAAKQLVRGLIEAARRVVVGLIRAFGEFLKGLVTVALAAFPATAERARRWIDGRVEDAVDTVNRAADALQEFAQRVLDALGAALDFILSVYQRAYLLLLEGLRLLAVGLIEIMERISYLVDAAGQMPDHFLGQASEELIGQDLTQPLPFELTAPRPPATEVAAAFDSGAISAEDAGTLTQTTFADQDIAVDQVASLELEPMLEQTLDLQDGEEREFGETSDPTRTLAAIQEELVGGEPTPTSEVPAPETAAAGSGTEPGGGPETDAAAEEDLSELSTEQRLERMMDAEPEPACPTEKSTEQASPSAVPEEAKFGPLTVGQRARYLTNQMMKGIRNWLSCNWPWLLAAAVGILTGLVVANILTGGAITAALPPLMQIIAMVMLGVAAGRFALYVGDYLSKGWVGEIAAAARSLARGLAVAAIELVFTLLFDLNAVIRAARQGLTATLRTGAATAREAGRTLARSGRRIRRAAVRTARAPGRAAALVGRVSLRRGRLIFRGVRQGFDRGARSLDDLARRLWDRVRFRRFKLERRGLRIRLLGYINPWVLLADGRLRWVRQVEGGKAVRVGERVTVRGVEGVVIGRVKRGPSGAVRRIAKQGQERGRAFFRELPDDLAKVRRLITGRGATGEHARRLRAAMLKKDGSGITPGTRGLPKNGVPPEGFHAHHIVPSGHKRAKAAQDLLAEGGIGINSSLNGVFVPPGLHGPLHTHKYIDEVIRRLERHRGNPALLRRELDRIAADILKGRF